MNTTTKNKIVHLVDAKKYICSCGYRYSHRSIIGTYVFYRISDNREITFSLQEIRCAVNSGW